MNGSARLSRLVRVLLLLGAEGASIGLFLVTARTRGLVGFVARNELSPAGRTRLIEWMSGSALIPCLLALALVVVHWRRNRGEGVDKALDRLSRLGRLLAVSLFLWVLPQMTSWRAWDGRDLMYLITAALLVVTFEPTLRVSLTAAGEMRLAERLRRLVGDRLSRIRKGFARFAPQLIVAAASTTYVIYTAHYSILQHLRRQTAGFDLGYFGTFFWNTIHGRHFYCPITHPRDGSYLSIHAEFAVYLLAPFYALAPKAQTLLVMQSLLLGTSAIPLYLFARRRLGSNWLAALVALAFLLYPPLHSPNFTDFHFLTISVFFVLWAAYFLDSERWVLFWMTAVATLMCREDLPFGGIAVGIAFLVSGYRARTGAALALLSAAYLATVKFYVMPKFGDPSFVYIYEKLVAPGEVGFKGVLRTLLTNPLFTLSTIVFPEKLPYVLHVFVPLAFLPLRMKRFWFLLFPGFFVALLSTGYMPVISPRFQYVTHFTPYVFIGAVLVLEQLGKTSGETVRRAAMGAMAAGTFLITHQFGALQKKHFFSGGGIVTFDHTDTHRENLRNLREVAATIPNEATLAATELDCPHLAEREYLFSLKFSTEGADYLLYGYDNIDFGAARRLVREALQNGTHGFHAERPGFVVIRRGAPTTRNDELLSKL